MSQAKNVPLSGFRSATWRAGFILPLCTILGVAVALRAYGIGSQSLWTDELFSRYYPDLFSLKYLWTTGLLRENSPPLYYMLLNGWMQLFGTSEAALRSLSLIASVLALPLVFLLGKELFDERRGLLGALVYALMPMQIDFAQEARTYALLLIPIALALFACARFLAGDLRQRVLWLYGSAVTVALYCHATTVFFIAACNIVVLVAILRGPRTARRDMLIHWVTANLVVGLFALPELWAIVAQGREGAGIEWIPPFRPVHVVRALSPVLVGTSTPNRFPGAELSLLLMAMLACALLVARPDRRSTLVLIAIPGVFICLVAAASLHQPIFIARIFCWLGVPIAVLLGHAIGMRSKLQMPVAAIAAVTAAIGLGYQFMAPQKEPWRELLAQLNSQLVHADVIVLAPLTDPTPFAYYAPGLAHLMIWDAGPHNNTENGDLPLRMGVRWITSEGLVKAIKSNSRTWLILRTPDLPNVDKLLARVPAPEQRVERTCGKVVCIAALSWSASTSDEN